MTEIYVRDDLAHAWRAEDPFRCVWNLQGEVYRAVANRRTLRFEDGGRAYFAKLHGATGWREVIKNLATVRLPVVGARNEFEACRHLEQHGIPAPRVAAFGERGWNPVQRSSFIICDALEGRLSLEDLAARWHDQPPTGCEKRRLVMEVARFARRLHGAGVLHRDFYICHLLLDERAFAAGRVELAVLDLHRARIYERIPRRWLIRDLAALLFSALDLPLGRRAWLRFVREYRQRPLRAIFADEGPFWAGVYRRAVALHGKGRRKGLIAVREPQ